MKNKFITFILFLIMVALIGIIGFFGIMIYSDFIGEEATEVIHSVGDGIFTETTEQNGEKKENTNSSIASIITKPDNNEDISYSDQSSSGKYFYEQLSENQKIIYNGLQENKEKMMTGTYVIEYGDAFSEVLAKDGGNKIIEADYQAAIESYMQDNVDVFYLDVSKLYMNIETTKKTFKTTYNVYIAPPTGSTYLKDEFTSEIEVRTALSQIERVKNDVLSKLTGDTYKDIIKIHDYLVDSIEYDKTYKAKGSYSIYGALVTKTCVCEGYAKAFKYLANAAGISCEIMQGTGKDSSGDTERHAWNCVYLNDNWYYIDVTWDDPILIGNGITPPGTKYKYFLKGSNSFTKDHFIENQLSTGGKVYTYPTMSDRDYN